MILVLTTKEGDFSHVKIIDWLIHYGADYKIMSGERCIDHIGKYKMNKINRRTQKNMLELLN